jgi:hypothetical protein
MSLCGATRVQGHLAGTLGHVNLKYLGLLDPRFERKLKGGGKRRKVGTAEVFFWL